MKKLYLAGMAILACSVAVSAYAEEKRYITDELSTWVRSGPGDQYRLVGKINAGEEVVLLQSNSDTQYGQIRDAENRTTWLPLSQISATPSLRSHVPALEQQVKQLTTRLASIDGDWNKRTAEMQQKVANSDSVINGLKQENEQLKKQLIVAEKKVDAANVQLDDKRRTIIMQWFMYGGGVAGIGLLAGLLLPHMVPRRKNKDRWMN